MKIRAGLCGSLDSLDDSGAQAPGQAARALELAQELIQPAVVSIKTAQWGDTRGRARAAPQRDLRPCDPQCHRRRDRAVPGARAGSVLRRLAT